MKVKKDPPKPQGLFGGVVFALVLGQIPFKEKAALRKKITANGGTISYIATKKCNFVICEANIDASNYGYQTAQKLGIPIVSSSYVDMCLNEKKLVPLNISVKEKSSDMIRKLEDEFKSGKISAKCGTEPLMASSKKNAFGTKKQLKQWSFMDNKGPDFHKYPYNVAKYTVLKGTPRRNGDVPFCVIEIHTSKVDEKDTYSEDFEKPKFCVFVDSGFLFHENTVNKGIRSSVKSCQFTNSRNAVLDCYSQLHKSYTSPPHTLTYWPRNETIPSFIGSPEFAKICESWILTNSSLDDEVKKLVIHLWTEVYKYLEDILHRKVTDIKINDVVKAESILFQLLKEVTDKSAEEFSQKWQKLSNIYYGYIGQKSPQKLTSKTAISKQQQLLQLIRDVLTVSEGRNHDGEANSILTIYKSLACWITHLKADSDEFLNIKEKVIASQNGNEEDALEVRNIFAVKRSAEDVGFISEMCNHQYLFHGSVSYNILGILSRGLLLRKTDWTEDSKLNSLGNGIYFSPSSSKSAKHSSASKTTGTRFMLLAEVALGKCFVTENALPDLSEPPEGYNSVQGFTDESSVGSDFLSKEYAIFQESQQRLAYLIEFSLKNETPLISTSPSCISSTVPMEMDPIEHVFSTLPQEKKVSAYDAFDEILFEKDKKTQYGLQGVSSSPIPLVSVHIRASIVDLASKVMIFQEYRNTNNHSVEAKYVFPLDDLAAVCGFEAFINKKHVVGVIEEKKQAYKQYREAVAEGHGAYLMDESGQDVFTITIGNLPAFSQVIIKIIYVAELKTENEHIVFDLSGCVAGDSEQDCVIFQSNTTTSSFASMLLQSSLEIGIEMPFEIRRIVSPKHNIITKKTDTMATVKLCKEQNIANGFQLWIDLAEVHVPRMWVEKSENDDDIDACMLAFYPVFSNEETESGSVIIMIDASNSMQDRAFHSAQTIALLVLHHIRDDWKFNIIFFGSIYEELFPVPQLKTNENASLATAFILEGKPSFGCTDLHYALRSCFLLPPQDIESPQNIFLVSDGHINDSTLVLHNVAKHSSETRIFSLGVGSSRLPCNQHFMKKLANKGAGAYEYFDEEMKSKWKNKVKQQLYKASQPALTDIRVEWQQLDNDPIPLVQAPQQIFSLFNGARQVIYGFVANCLMATLTAKMNNTTLSTVVSTSELSKTKGSLLHSLTAKAIIRDWSDGLLDDDDFKDEATKTAMISYIISLSQKHGILSSLTSYIAIEKRNEGDTSSPTSGPSVRELVNMENVDKLPYLVYDDVEDPRDDISEQKQQTSKHSDLQTSIPLLAKIWDIDDESTSSHQPPPVPTPFTYFKPAEQQANIPSSLFGKSSFQQSMQMPRAFPDPPPPPPPGLLSGRKYAAIESRSKAWSSPRPSSDSLVHGMFSFLSTPPSQPIPASHFCPQYSASDDDMGCGLIEGSISSCDVGATKDKEAPVATLTLFGARGFGAGLSPSPFLKKKKMAWKADTSSPMRSLDFGIATLGSQPRSDKRAGICGMMRHRKVNIDDAVDLAEPALFPDEPDASGNFFQDELDVSIYATMPRSIRHCYPPDDSPPSSPTSESSSEDDTSDTSDEELVRNRLSNDGESRYALDFEYTRSNDDASDIPDLQQLGHRPDAKFILDGKGNLPLCLVLIKAISSCSWTSSWSNKIWILLKGGSSFKECELLSLQSELDSLAKMDPTEIGTFWPMSDGIWDHQTAHGYFTMDCLDDSLSDGCAFKITKLLDDGGLSSMGGKREEILRMCATIAAVLVFLKNIPIIDISEGIADDDTNEEFNIEKLISMSFQENFNTKSVIKLLKALAYIMWVYKRNPLMFKSLELGSKEKVYTWEAFLLFHLRIMG